MTGAFFALNGYLSVGMLSCFLGYANQYTKPFNEISGVVTELQNAIACAARVLELIDEEPQIPEDDDAVELTGVKGEVELSPKEKIDVSHFTFDDDHINKEREHKVTREEAEKYIQEADVSVTRWNGRFVNYYGPKGAVFVDTENANIRTAFHKEQFDEHVRKMREVLKNNGKG